MKPRNKGVTLPEIMMVVAIMGVATFLVRIVINLMADVYSENSQVSNQQEMQAVLYNMAKEVRNSDLILTISSDTLRLRAFDTRHGYDPATIMNLTNLSTVTYRYAQQGGQSFMQRTVERPEGTDVKKLLVNRIRPPNTTDYIFSLFPPSELPPYEGVAIALRMTGAYQKDKEHIYEINVMKRSHVQ